MPGPVLGRDDLPFTIYITVTVVAGALVLGALLLFGQDDASVLRSGAFWLLTSMAVVAELVPLRVPRGDHEGELTVSTTFGFAVLLLLGPVPSALSLLAAVLVADLVHRKEPWKIFFNAAQYMLPVGAASLLLAGTATWYAGDGQLSWLDIGTALLAGSLFAAVNTLVMSAALAAAGRSGAVGSTSVSVWDVLRDDLAFAAWSYAILISLAPIVAVTATASVWAVPLFIVPAVAVYQSVSIYLDRERHALHDVLTGLPNRALFEDRVEQAIAGAQRNSTNMAVLILNIDQFKEVNATLGYEAGDRMLRDLAARLDDQVRDVDTVARLGADEFGVVVLGLEDLSAAQRVLFALRDAVARPFAIGKTNLAVEASIGGVLSPQNGTDPDSLIAAADHAMGEAKRLRLGHQWYAPRGGGRTAGRMRLLADLRVAIDAGDLELHYQPKASLPSGHISGVEALVRWRRNGGDLVPPAQFIPVAEETGLMADVTRYVLDDAIAQIRRWHDAEKDLRVAVNISARDLHDPELPDDIARMLAKHGVSPTSLELEITESSIMVDIEQALATLFRLREMGIRLAIDDFGTGNTSLAQLPRLPVDVLKIDRSFVERLEYGADDLIVRTTIELGRGLGLEVVAEGVATELIWDRLVELGCDYAQGFYFSRPVVAGDVELLMDGDG